MSIYSGLPTRQDETNYNKLLCRLIVTLQQHIIELCNGVIAQKYSIKYSKITAKMQTYEQHKYLPPKFSTLMKPLQDAMRNSLVRFNKNQGYEFNLRLQSVKEEEQLPSQRKKTRSKEQLQMRQSGVINKKIIQKQQFASQSYIKSKEKQRSFSVVSQKKNKPMTEFKRTQKLNPRQSLQDFHKKRETKTSSGARLKLPGKQLLTQSQSQYSSASGGVNLMKALSLAAEKNKR